MRSWHRCVLTSTRRAWLASAVAWSCASSLATAQSRPKNTTARCPRCFGLTRIPLKDAKPFVWVDGMPPSRAEDAVSEQACPECQMQPLNGRIVVEIEQISFAIFFENRAENPSVSVIIGELRLV